MVLKPPLARDSALEITTVATSGNGDHRVSTISHHSGGVTGISMLLLSMLCWINEDPYSIFEVNRWQMAGLDCHAQTATDPWIFNAIWLQADIGRYCVQKHEHRKSQTVQRKNDTSGYSVWRTLSGQTFVQDKLGDFWSVGPLKHQTGRHINIECDICFSLLLRWTIPKAESELWIERKSPAIFVPFIAVFLCDCVRGRKRGKQECHYLLFCYWWFQFW